MSNLLRRQKKKEGGPKLLPHSAKKEKLITDREGRKTDIIKRLWGEKVLSTREIIGASQSLHKKKEKTTDLQ